MRKVFILSLLFVAGASFAQTTVYLRTGNFVNTTPQKNPSTNPDEFANYIYNGKHYLWLQFNQLPTEQQKAMLLQTGIELYSYLPDNTFIASFPVGYNYNQLNAFNVYAVSQPTPAAKIDDALYVPTSIPWAVTAAKKLAVNVSYINAVTEDVFLNSLNSLTISYTKKSTVMGDMVIVEADIDNIKKIAAHPLTIFIEPIGAPPVKEFLSAINNHRNNTTLTTDNWTTGKKLDGRGVNVAIGDDGFIGPHIDFTGRISSNASDMTASSTHGDHCSGIILGAGNLNPTVRGQAPGANLYAYDGYDPYSLFPGIYRNDTVRIISHSLGQNCNDGYTSNARTSDILIRTYPSLMYVHSAGNSGNTSCGGISNWRNITGGFKAGKDVITVANLDVGDVADASSSRGPLPDGRIKPDISAVGSNVNSTQPDNTFAVFSGTSMSCPAVAGSMAVLYQSFKQKNNAEPNGSLMKVIALNTADDIGNEGPDFIYGWGRINMRRAVSCIENTRYFRDSITTGITKQHTISIPANVATAKVMVYWADKEATAGVAKALVNNIDATITDDALNIYSPWVIDLTSGQNATTCAAPAIKGGDSINNMEQIQLDAPAAGNYTLSVLGKKIPNGPQVYYVVYEFIYKNEITVTHPIGGETFVPTDIQRIRWDAENSTTPFKVEYSVNGGTTWSTISSTVPATRRYLDWTVPTSTALISKAALIRVSQGTANDVSDTTFVILRVPSNVNISPVCETKVLVSWTSVLNAVGYDVFKLGDKYMEVVASTTTATSAEVANAAGLNYYAVRAKLSNTGGGNGRRTNAVAYTNNSVTTCPVPVKLISFTALTNANSNVQLKWKVANEEGMLNYIIEKSTTPTFEIIDMVGSVKPNNKTAEQTYTLTDAKPTNAAIVYYRLKMVEANKATYSNTQAIRQGNRNTEPMFAVNPNPAIHNINLFAYSNASAIEVKLFNSLGKVAIVKTFNNVQQGDTYQLPINNLASGIYYVTVTDKQANAIVFKQEISIVK